MAHVELSLSGAFTPPAETAPEQTVDNFTRWVETVSHAVEPCLVLDRATKIVAASPAGYRLLGFPTPAHALGRPLLRSDLRLLDFSAARNELTEQDTERIPPLLALSSGRLARGLLRIGHRPPSNTDATVDAIATPLLVHDTVVGSLTFFAEI